jgi:hypothetical protein
MKTSRRDKIMERAEQYLREHVSFGVKTIELFRDAVLEEENSGRCAYNNSRWERNLDALETAITELERI